MTILEDQDQRMSKIEQSVNQLRWEVGKLKNGSEKLEKSNHEVVSKITGLEHRLDSRSQLLATISESLRRLDPSNREAPAAEKAIASSSVTPDQLRVDNQVRVDNHELSRPEAQLGYRGSSGALANRESLLWKVDMPVYNGSSSPFGWIARVERIFRLGDYSDNQKLDMVSISLEGSGLRWFNWELEHELFRDWFDFKQRFLDSFGESRYDESGKRLCCTQQTGSIEVALEELSSQVKGKDDYEKVSKPEINGPEKQAISANKIEERKTSLFESVESSEHIGKENGMEKHYHEHSFLQASSQSASSKTTLTSSSEITSSQPNIVVEGSDETVSGENSGKEYWQHTKESVPAIVQESLGDCVSLMVGDILELKSGEVHQNYSSPEVLLNKVSIPKMAKEEEFSKKLTLMQKNEPRDQLQSQSGVFMDGLNTDFVTDDLCVHQGEELYRFQVTKEDELALKSPYLETTISAYEVSDVLPHKTEKKNMKREKEKLLKSWKFKYKQGLLQVQQQDKNGQFLLQKRVQDSLLDKMRMQLIARGLNQSIIVVGEFKMKHKWRDKFIQPVFELELLLNSVVIIIGVEICWDYMDKVMVAMLLLQRLMIQPKQKQIKCYKSGAFKYNHKIKELAKWDITMNHLLLIKQTSIWFCIQVNLFHVKLQQHMKLHQFSKSKLCKYNRRRRLSLDLTKGCELWRK